MKAFIKSVISYILYLGVGYLIVPTVISAIIQGDYFVGIIIPMGIIVALAFLMVKIKRMF